MTNVLTFELQKTLEWRKRKLERHSADARLHSAVELLERLSSMPGKDDTVASEYEQLHEMEGLSPEALSNIHSEVLGDIGFRSHPNNVDEVIGIIVANAKSEASA